MQTRITIVQMKGEYLWDTKIVVPGQYTWSPMFTYKDGGAVANELQAIGEMDKYYFKLENLLDITFELIEDGQ